MFNKISMNNLLSKWTFLIASMTTFACFALLAIGHLYSTNIIVFGFIFALPILIGFFGKKYHRVALMINLLALAALVLLASITVWQSVLLGQTLDLSLNLLLLLLILVLGLIWQLLAINISQNNDNRLNALVYRARKIPSALIMLVIALALSDLLLLLLSILPDGFAYFVNKIIGRGIIPPLTVTLFFWGLLLIVSKYIILLSEKIEHSASRVYFDAIQAKIGNSEKDKKLVLDLLWNQFESFYTLPHYINWAIPILGFIGTVLGISLATEQLGLALGDNSTQTGQLLSSALTPLGIAFDTTLVALSLSIVLALLQTLLYRSEAKYLDKLEEKFK